jgi:hypothetical protein
MKFNPYSISKMSTFNQCPKKFEFSYINKIKIDVPQNVALYKGSYIHEVLENNFDYDVPFETNEIFTEKEKEKAKEIIKKFEGSELGAKYKILIPVSNLEEKFGFKIEDKQIVLTDFWDKEGWFRGAIDLYIIHNNRGVVVDYKSGKDHSLNEDFGTDQAMMYSIYLFTKYPNINEVKGVFCFVEHSTEKSILFKREKLTEYLKHFYTKTKKVEQEKIFGPNVSALCDYCDYFSEGLCTAPSEHKKRTETFIQNKISLDF